MRKPYRIIFCYFILLFVAATSAAQEIPGDSIMIRGLTVTQFKKLTSVKNKLVLVNFSADWCIVCKKQKPVLDEIGKQYKDSLVLLEIDMELNPLIAEYFEVDGLPVNILYKNGEMVWDRMGLQRKSDFMDILWKHRITQTKK